MHKKPHLPSKLCVVCQRPFSWRKKWRKDWENVEYCSQRCRGKKPRPLNPQDIRKQSARNPKVRRTHEA
ncbi:MAG: DUF2256 domain-containing protein [Gammaproteobacteria bacterium]|nr:DUF2256 domain-containing protein [Gammaproteobacteria bacterium]NNC96961.1 DUF2256 domain-containing protein [Gammaproteobacteria bacterium]NNM14569.1 DUF2256 domain-containing protein [Gammaproteobacteria bacterium]